MAEWYTKIAEQVVGPLSAEQLKALAAGGRLAPVDPVAQSADGPWVPASRVKGLFEVAAVDDEPEEEVPPVDRPVDEPPIPQPPVVMSSQTAAQAPPSQAAPPPVEAAAPAVDSPPAGGFAIQTEEVAATERFQKKKQRAKKSREPLTKKQKNARAVKRLAIAIVAGIVVLISIPYLRKLTLSTAEPAPTKEPVAADVDLAVTGDGLDGAFDLSSAATRSRPAASPAGSAGDSNVDRQADPMETDSAPAADLVGVKKVRYALERPRMVSDDGRVARPAKPVLVVELELSVQRPDASVRFRGWDDYADEISLTDDRGVKYKARPPRVFNGMYVDGQCRETEFLTPEEPKTDVILFAWPEDEAPELSSASDESLKLLLPKAAYGEQGELAIAIPLSEIEDAREEPQAAMGGTSDNVREDDGGPIPIPGMMD